ncbi:MAG: ATP-binding protein, partial [Actinobacteria bacterium]|nr:ATP-binding protein [Actinomycetota bacterium]
MRGLLGGGMMGGGDGSGDFEVQSPDDLTTFADVGGMEELKEEVGNTVGLMLEHPEHAERYGIDWNGILLHGPPGVGKTFLAHAIAGEYGLNFIHVSTGDLVSSLVGGSARNIDKAFETALQNLPCLLFFDEFDSVAQRRDKTPDQESRRTVNQLLTSLEAHRTSVSCSSWPRRTRSSISTLRSSGRVASTGTSASTCRTPTRAARSSGRSWTSARSRSCAVTGSVGASRMTTFTLTPRLSNHDRSSGAARIRPVFPSTTISARLAASRTRSGDGIERFLLSDTRVVAVDVDDRPRTRPGVGRFVTVGRREHERACCRPRWEALQELRSCLRPAARSVC